MSGGKEPCRRPYRARIGIIESVAGQRLPRSRELFCWSRWVCSSWSCSGIPRAEVAVRAEVPEVEEAAVAARRIFRAKVTKGGASRRGPTSKRSRSCLPRLNRIPRISPANRPLRRRSSPRFPRLPPMLNWLPEALREADVPAMLDGERVTLISSATPLMEQ